MKKRITIRIDISEVSPEVASLLDDLERQLDYRVSEYDPKYTFDCVIEDIKDEERSS